MSTSTILLVEDDLQFVELFEARLKAAGFHVLTLPDNRRVVEILINEAPDLVILDWDLGPEATQHGTEVYGEIMAARPTPVLKISNFTNRKTWQIDNQLAIETGQDYRHVDKLYGTERIIQIVQARLSSGNWPLIQMDPSKYL